MSEEENKAIKYLKRHIIPYENEDGNLEFLINDVLLNLIDKQQKEIEEKNIAVNKMSKDISRQLEEIEKLKFNNHMVGKWNEYLDKDCISKNKIRGMLNYLDNTDLNNYEIVMAFRKMMRELLEENDGDHIPRID